MKKKYIFHYDQTKRPWDNEEHKLLLKHDGMECLANVEYKYGLMMNLVYVLFDDGVEWSVLDYELEEINAN